MAEGKKEKCSPHGWTLDTLETYLSDKIANLRKLIEDADDRNLERFASRQEALKIATDATDKASTRFDIDLREKLSILQELRTITNENVKQALTKEEYELHHADIVKDVTLLAQRVIVLETAKTTQSKGLSQTGQVVLGIFSVAASIAAVVTVFYVLLARH
jgi:hypothetical protein